MSSSQYTDYRKQFTVTATQLQS